MNYEAIAEYSQIASAALFLLVMIWIWMRFIQPAVLAAQDKANAQIAEAQRHRDQAKAVLDSLQGEITAAQHDAEAIKQRCVVQAQAEREATSREAREAGERAVRNAQGELQRARAAARVQLRDELLSKALDAARSIAMGRVDDRTNERLVRAFMASLATTRAANGNSGHG